MHKRLVLDGIIMGIVAGFLSILYRMAIEEIDYIRALMFNELGLESILINLLVVMSMGVVVHLLLKWEPLSSGSGIPQVQGENQGYVSMRPLRVLVAKFLGGMAGNFGGLSLGREGPSIQIGAAVGKWISKILKRDENETIHIMSAGASAGLAAAFNAPMAGTLFTLEEMHKKFVPTLLVPSLIASVVADFISKNVFGIKPVFLFTIREHIGLQHYWHLIILGVFCGLLGVVFNKMLVGSLQFYNYIPLPEVVKRMIPFASMAVTGYIFYMLLGGGHHLLSSLEAYPVSLGVMMMLFVAKLLLTCLCYGSGAQGGIFLPVLVLGGLVGTVYYTVMSCFGFLPLGYYSNMIILGMVGYLTAVIRSPILSIVLVAEMTGKTDHLLSVSLVSIIAYVTADMTKVAPIYETLLKRMVKYYKEEPVE